jgi:hypothetical protein
MAAMSTALTEFDDSRNSRTWILADHSVMKPRVVIQHRTVPQGSAASNIAKTSVKVVYGTADTDGNPLEQKVSFEVVPRYPQGADPADIAAALAILRDIVASDEFASTVTTQGYLKA